MQRQKGYSGVAAKREFDLERLLDVSAALRAESVGAARTYYGSLAEPEKDVIDARIRAELAEDPMFLQKTGKNSLAEVFFDDYLGYMAHPKSWATETILRCGVERILVGGAPAKVLVYQKIGDNLRLSDDEPAFPDKCARLLWNGVNHYQVLRGSFCVAGAILEFEGRGENTAHIVEETKLRNEKNKLKRRVTKSKKSPKGGSDVSILTPKTSRKLFRKMDELAALPWRFDDMEKENKGEYREAQAGVVDLKRNEFLANKAKPFTVRSATLTVVGKAKKSSFNVSLCPGSRFSATINAIEEAISRKIVPTVKTHARVIRKKNLLRLTLKPKSIILLQHKDSSWVRNKVARWMR